MGSSAVPMPAAGSGILQDVLNFINAGRAAKSVSDANIAAEHGVLDATKGGQTDIHNAINTGRTDLNKTAADVTAGETATNAPYLQAGNMGVTGLEDYAKSNPQFKFSPQDYFNDPAYKFQLDQGTNAIQNHASALGTGSSGDTLKELTKYGQGLASTYYNDAFNRSLSSFTTNRDTTLTNLMALIQTGEFGAKQQMGVGNQNLSVQELLAKLGLQGSEASANLGLKGSTTAGDFAVGAGQAHAGGIIGQGNAVNQGISDIAGLIGMIP